MTEYDRETIRHMADRGVSPATISMVYGVSRTCVRKILNTERPEEAAQAEVGLENEGTAPTEEEGNATAPEANCGQSAATSLNENTANDRGESVDDTGQQVAAQPPPGDRVETGGCQSTTEFDGRSGGARPVTKPEDRPPPKSAKRLMLGQGKGGWQPKTCQYIASAESRKEDDKCGAPTQEGSAYCPAHHARCWIKPWQKKDNP